jgi:hypothetical protein
MEMRKAAGDDAVLTLRFVGPTLDFDVVILDYNRFISGQ